MTNLIQSRRLAGRRPNSSAPRTLPVIKFALFAVATYLVITLRSITHLQFDFDTVFLLELPRTNADDWFRTFATTAHPFGVLAQQLYLDSVKELGIPEVTAWKVAIGGSIAIQAIFVVRKFGTTALLVFFCGLATFPSLWRNVITLEEEVIGMTLFGTAALLLMTSTSRRTPEAKNPESDAQLSERGALDFGAPFVTVCSAACLWHFQYWYILSLALLTLSLGAYLTRSARRQRLLIWATTTAFSLPLLHLVGIVRPTPYHQQFLSLTSHMSAGESISGWVKMVFRGLIWHGERYVGDDALTSVLAGTTGTGLLLLFFLGPKISRHTKIVAGVLLFSSLGLPIVYEPTSRERWLPFWTIILVCGVVLFRDERYTEDVRLSSDSDSIHDSGSRVRSKRAGDVRGTGLIRSSALIAMFAIAALSSATWHGNFSSDHLSNWSKIFEAERCSVAVLTSAVSPYLNEETLVIVGHAYGRPGKSSQSPIDEDLLNFLASLPNPESTHVIIAGDLMENPTADSILSQGYHLQSRFRQVYLAPGNHDLWDAYSEQYLQAGFKGPGVYSIDRLTILILDSTSVERSTNVLDDVGVVSDGVIIVTHHVVQFDDDNSDGQRLEGHNRIDQEVSVLEWAPMDELGPHSDVIAVHGDAGLYPTMPLQCQRATFPSAILAGLGGNQLDRVLVVRNLKGGAQACFLGSTVESCFGKVE